MTMHVRYSCKLLVVEQALMDHPTSDPSAIESCEFYCAVNPLRILTLLESFYVTRPALLWFCYVWNPDPS